VPILLGVVLGVGRSEVPVLPEARGLLAPGGALWLAAGVLLLRGRTWPGHQGAETTPLGWSGVLLGAGLLGAGLDALTGEPAFRLALVPALAAAGLLALGVALLGRRTSYGRRLADQEGPRWPAARLGLLAIAAAAPVGVAWSVGAI
jgi:hypothetical protein